MELLLDPCLDAAVRAQWALLEAADLPNAGRHTGETNCPHVTLAVAPMISADREAAIAQAAQTAADLPVPVRMGGLVLFGGQRGEFVLARPVLASVALLAVHQAVYDAADDDSLPHTRPGDWTPHVTLARRLSPAQVADALALPGLGDELTGQAIALRRWDSEARRAWLIG